MFNIVEIYLIQNSSLDPECSGYNSTPYGNNIQFLADTTLSIFFLAFIEVENSTLNLHFYNIIQYC